jgi:fatty acid desaturase
MPLRGDLQLRGIEWRDLCHLTSSQKMWELTLSLPWLLGSIVLFQVGWGAPGLVAAFFFFLTGLRQAHGAQHYSMGVGRRLQDAVLFILSVLMVTSLHALQVTHLHHHRHALEASDVEAVTAKMPWWKALAVGPYFILKLNWVGYRIAKPSKRSWIIAEIAATVTWLVGGMFYAPIGLQSFVLAMIAGECFTGFFAVWTVHHDCEPESQPARTQRGWWKNLVTYDMFYHLEHHLFPAVPTARLPELAARLHRLRPDLARKQVF